jgi:hypothetical protein
VLAPGVRLRWPCPSLGVGAGLDWARRGWRRRDDACLAQKVPHPVGWLGAHSQPVPVARHSKQQRPVKNPPACSCL